jgi:hypothetical protein
MRNVLTVFLASPSDLADERKKAFQVAAEVNESIKRWDWWIDLLGWEDTLPGYGRPQAMINRDVERCDLFIGLLWRRWGTSPAQDSRFSSGFEEEFSIARSRREHAISPEIWMFFKTVEPAQTADAGTQLQNVIKFRESLITSKAIFFKEFEDVNDWEKKLRSYLYQHFFDIAGAPSAAPERPSGRATQPANSISARADSPDAAAAGDQIATLARSLEPAFETGYLSEITGALNDEREAAFLAVRSVLLSAALVSASGTSATALPIHELNTLYRYRDRLRATSHELSVLFRSILADDLDLKPGWYWFRDYEVAGVEWSLISIALFGDDTEARARSFEILRRAQVAIFKRVRDQFLERSLRDIPSTLRDAAWAYLVDTTTPEERRLLREWAGGTWLESRVQWLQTWTDADRNLDDFLQSVPDPQLIPEPMKQSIGSSIARLSDESLRALLSMSVFHLSDAAAAELESRGAPIGDYKRSPDPTWGALPLASAGGVAMTGLGESESDEERYKRLSRENSDALRTSLDWYTLDGATSYQLLVERGEIARNVARGDLLNGFKRVRDESYQQLERKVGYERAARHDQGFKDLHGFITRTFAAAALTALATEPTPGEVAIARRFLNDNLARPAALRIIASKGTAKDADDLIDIARSSFGADRRLALEGVQRLTTDKLGAARTLLASEGSDMHRAALSLVVGLGDHDALPFLEQLLSHEDADLRVAAVGQIRKRVDNERLAELLRRYTELGTYYYNVVVWLDRLLYAPAPISKYYEAELERKLGVLDR